MTTQRIVLVPPASKGSKGDEGMVRGAIALFGAFPIVIADPGLEASWLDALKLPADEMARLSECSGPLEAFAEQYKDGDILFFIGADVIDGTCGPGPAMERIALMSAALSRGLPVYVSCSFRSVVQRDILEQLCRLRDVRYLIRDEYSLANLHCQTGITGRFFPDLSFFLQEPELSSIAEDVAVRLAEARKTSGPIIGVNFAEHSFRSFSDDHSDGSRHTFVSTVLASLAAEHHSAVFVLLSNDTRAWPNHPSDDAFAGIAEEWITESLGPKRAIRIDPAASYTDNIAVVRLLDLLVTGRMHLSYTAFRAGTVPLMLMGEGKRYSSIDKMRGAFDTYMETTEPVITRLENIGQTSGSILKCKDVLLKTLVRSNRERDAGCAAEATLLFAETRTFSLEADLATVRRDAECRIVALEANLNALIAAGDTLAEKTRRAYARPWRPLKLAMQGALLRFVLLLGPVFSKRKRAQLKRSLEKRLPSIHRTQWIDTVKMMAPDHISLPDLMDCGADRRDGLPNWFVHRVLCVLASTIEPISTRHARRFRKSAAKRAPNNFRQLCGTDFRTALTDVRCHPLPVNDSEGGMRILVADSRLPRADMSAGERATVGLLSDLLALGFEVEFIPNDMMDHPIYRPQLEALGITVITRQSGPAFAASYVEEHGHRFDAFYFVRVDVAEALLPTARAKAPGARVLFHAPDLCFLREMRAAELSGDPAEQKSAQQTKVRETAIMQAADHVVLVSPAELPYVEKTLPRERISVFPALYSPVVATPSGFASRQHMFFLGGFGHRPNHGAVKWFVDEIWPTVRAALPEAEFHIVGADAPPDVIALGDRPGVRFVGYVADLSPVLANYRLSVVPLLYGAGIKGKIGMALGAGVPTITTKIGAEGMGIHDGVHALVRDSATVFAEAVIALYRDEEMWSGIAQNGQNLVAENFSDAANRAAFFRVLESAGALPLDLYAAHCQAASPTPLPDPDQALPVDVSIIVPAHNQWSLTRACLNSVALGCLATGLRCEVILADDLSTDETQDAAHLYPGLKVVRQPTKQGFLHNCNSAAKQARGRMLLLLDNDTVVLPNWLLALAETMETYPDAAIVGSKLVDPDGTIQEAGGVLFADGLAVPVCGGDSGDAVLSLFDREVDYCSGASLLVRRSFWKDVDGFDSCFASAYCEDADLAMRARSQGMQVVYSARSVVIHFEHGSHGEQHTTPKMHMKRNYQKLFEKWPSQFATKHLPPNTPVLIAAAHAERTPPPRARAQRQSGRLNVLYFSPFPSHPDNHGNQATIQSFARKFKKLGHRVHFALLESSLYDEDALAAMRTTWDTFDLLPNSRPFWAKGTDIPFDGWYDPTLGKNVWLMCQEYDIDVVFCSYVFQSKLLDCVPAHVLSVIDTHDKMGNRYEMLRRNGQPVEFFSCTPEDEGAYLRRADLVAARRFEEARYFNEVTGRDTAFVLPHVEEVQFLDRSYTTLGRVGVVASANRINLINLHDFLAEIAQRCGGDCPFTVEVAGQVKSMIADLLPEQQRVFQRPWVRMLGFVPEISAFYRNVDLIVSPVTMGTGINVKTVQAMAFGMPLMTTRVGIKGIETDEPLHRHETLAELVDSLFSLTERPGELERLAAISVDRYQGFLQTANEAFCEMFRHPKLVEVCSKELNSTTEPV